MNVEELTVNIRNIARTCRERGISEVIISGVIRKQSERLTAFMRKKYTNFAKKTIISSSSNGIKNEKLFYQDGVHRIGSGPDCTELSVGKFHDYINSLSAKVTII